MKLFAVYFSGTGNTKYAVERFLTHFPGSEAHSIEEPIDFLSAARSFDMILVAHPIYGSEMPLLMRDFLRGNQALFENKDLVTLVTQYLFSGDGGSLAFRLVRKQIRTHLASLHVNMPVNLNVPPFFTVKNGAENGKKLSKANQTIDRCAEAVRQREPCKKGKGLFPFLLGYLSQRLWYRLFVFPHYRSKLAIDPETCTLCRLCAADCPAGNLKLADERVVPQNRCMLCYRCLNRCPAGAITLFSHLDGERQYRGAEGGAECGS